MVNVVALGAVSGGEVRLVFAAIDDALIVTGKLVTTGPDEPIPGPVRHLWLPLSLEELHAITNSAPS